LLPAFVLCWICVGVALDAASRIRTPGYAGIVVATVVWSAWLTVSNLGANNLHSTPQERSFETFFARFGNGSVLVQPDIPTAHMILYKVLGERASAASPPTLAVWSGHGGREFSIVRSTPAHPVSMGDDRLLDSFVRDGRQVFAFGREGEEFRTHGFGVEPLRLPDRTICEFLPAMH